MFEGVFFEVFWDSAILGGQKSTDISKRKQKAYPRLLVLGDMLGSYLDDSEIFGPEDLRNSR